MVERFGTVLQGDQAIRETRRHGPEIPPLAPRGNGTLLNLYVFALIVVSAAPAVLAQGNISAEADDPAVRVEPATDSQTAGAARMAPLTLSRRYRWAAWSSVSTQRLAGYAISSAWSTMTNSPDEYGPHWDGYAKRIGMRLASGAVGNTMEASVGALWGEDPRYVRAVGQPLKNRLAHVAKMTFIARNRNGGFMPAYARYISVPANSYLSNTWRADSEGDARHAAIRIPMSFLSRAIGNAFTEFWPDAAKWFHRLGD